jgi:hypothetical protein
MGDSSTAQQESLWENAFGREKESLGEKRKSTEGVLWTFGRRMTMADSNCWQVGGIRPTDKRW